MKHPAASHGVSKTDGIYLNAASCLEFNPADFTIFASSFLFDLCNLRNLRIKRYYRTEIYRLSFQMEERHVGE